ncbi:S8 family serine peptidase [Nonomuraea basaltis]|uniref:S8 family serine peptidase n=1 Tax=Nonomuraea basaltis TaxID=2495887 RepID=UPI0014863275|nr:S8 family serine peptidase [Nonomuraea basaltis]
MASEPSTAVLRTIGETYHSGGYPRLAVVEMPAERAATLTGQPGLYVEPDQPLTRGLSVEARGNGSLMGELRTITFHVLDDGDRPIEGAAITLQGTAFTAFTAADGRAEMRLPIEVLHDAAAMIVTPPRGCWPTRVNRPRLTSDGPNVAVCTRITTTNPEFPDRPIDSWGTRVMGFDRLPPTHRGHAVRVALIDSGAAAGHPDLADRIPGGRDVIRQDDKTWQDDLVGTGTHHAVLIAGRDDGTGVVGLAPETEVHICRVAPEGWTADLIEALDYCIDQQVDVAMITYGSAAPSSLLDAKIDEARRNGIACIAAAGDSGGLISYPAALPGVLTVGALGQLGTFPLDSADVGQVTGLPTPEGFFVPHFSNTGPELDCVAPGVAVVSGLPPTSYGPAWGTGVAAAHVVAVAALVLGHHPMFRPEPGRAPASRDSTRVDRLFQVIRASCRPLPQLGAFQTGSGLPDAAVAVGVAPWGTHATLSAPYGTVTGLVTREEQTEALLAPLDAAVRAAGLVEHARG